ncbi:MAG: DUF4918 family protein [Bacteroidales bacterium]
MTFADKVIEFNRQLGFKGTLPDGIRIMNPFADSPEALKISETFYRKYYNDQNTRKIILGINPGRFGAGITGIPFTDTKRLNEKCGITTDGFTSHETSSVFIYDMIESYGGPEKFYSKYYINSVCPLGFVKLNNLGREVNFNYYDDRDIASRVTELIIFSLQDQVSMGIDTKKAYCLGTGRNFRFLKTLNDTLGLFEEIIPLEHPRYIMQYRLREKENYIKNYIEELE